MHSRHEHGGITWVDLQSPSAQEVRDVASEFGIGEAIAEQLLLPASKARAEFYDRYAYVVMHFPALKHSHTMRDQEVDFLVGKDFMITAHYDTIDPMHKFSKVFEVHAATSSEPLGEHAGFLFFYTVKKLYKAMEHELDFIRKELGQVEDRIFSGREVEVVFAISASARALLNLRQTIEPHREVLRTVEEQGPSFFGENFSPFLRALSNEYYRVHNHVSRATDSLHELRETNNSLLTTKQNETIKTLTIMAFLMLPLSFIAELFAMHTTSSPLLGTPYDFFKVLGLMVFVGAGLLLYFKYRKWL